MTTTTANRVQAFLADTLPREPGFELNPVQVAYAGSLTQSLASPSPWPLLASSTSSKETPGLAKASLTPWLSPIGWRAERTWGAGPLSRPTPGRYSASSPRQSTRPWFTPTWPLKGFHRCLSAFAWGVATMCHGTGWR